MPAAPPSLAAASFQAAGGIDVLRWPGLASLGVDAAVTTRGGGVSTGPYDSLNLGLHVGDDPAAVTENRRRAAAVLAASLGDLVFGTQVHGTHVASVGSGDSGRGAAHEHDAIPETDALVTTEAGPVLVTLVADCSPILLVDPGARVLATVHAGWRGAVGGMARAALDAMRSAGADPDRIHAVIGPTVSPDVYEVGPEVADAAQAALGSQAPRALSAHGDRWHFDVAGANRILLEAHGVPARQIHLSPVATDDPRFFSDRAARPCGRFALLARLRPLDDRSARRAG